MANSIQLFIYTISFIHQIQLALRHLNHNLFTIQHVCLQYLDQTTII